MMDMGRVRSGVGKLGLRLEQGVLLKLQQNLLLQQQQQQQRKNVVAVVGVSGTGNILNGTLNALLFNHNTQYNELL